MLKKWMINDIILLLFVKIKRRLIMDKLFKLKENGIDVCIEVFVGLIIFFVMSYIFFVNL